MIRLAFALLAVALIGLSEANMSLPPGMDIFGPGVDEKIFQHPYSARKCSDFGPPLIRWLKDYSATMSPVEVKTFKGKGCGLVAKEAIKSGAQVMKIPGRVAWTKESATAADIGKGFNDLSPMEQLVLFAAVEHRKGAKSMWSPYLDSTPTMNEMTNVVYWTEQERDMLEGSHLIAFMKTAMKEMNSIHEMSLKKFSTLRKVNITLEDVMWAWGMVHSRQVSFGDRSLQAIIPLVDLINCGEKSNVKVEAGQERTQSMLFLIADRDIAPGEELLFPYPPQENTFIAHRLGFALTNNTNDKRLVYYPTYFTDFSWGRDHQESEVRKEFYKYLKLDKDGKEWNFSPESGPSFDLINAARARVIAVPDVSDASAVLPREKMFSKANEVAAYEQILNITLERGSKYVSTPENDLALLKSGKLTPRQRVAVQVRLGEKRMLEQVVEKIRKEIADIKAGKKKAAKKDAKKESKGEPAKKTEL